MKNVDGKNLEAQVLVYMNVVDFRYINESWSEEDGNRTLQFIYQSLQKGLHGSELVCRSGMDHFFMLLNEPDDQAVADRIRKAIEEMNGQIQNKFIGFTIEFTIGACRLRENGNFSSLMNKAMFASKLAEEKNTCIFFGGKTAGLFDREAQLNRLFEKSLKNYDFQIYLQPKVPTNPTKDCEAEALARWKHPEEGMIPPGEFILILERSPKICDLDLYMFEQVCRLVFQWIRDGKTVTRVSVNVSRFHLRDAGTDICKKYREIKEMYQIPDGVIELELTETLLLEDNQLSFVKMVLDGFRSCGLKVALDDFGFAYSSLALLKEFEVDVLKLDRSFFVSENKKSRKIVQNIIRLAHDLGMCVVAEGIEKMEQVDMLREMGCDLIQGFVYSKPLPVREFESWRDARRK